MKGIKKDYGALSWPIVPKMLVPCKKSSSLISETLFLDGAVVQEANIIIRVHLICCYRLLSV
jgi:hypothetical protein